MPTAAPLPAIPSSARTLDELEGRAAAGGGASPGPPGFITNGPTVRSEGPPQGLPSAGGMPGSSLLSLLNPLTRAPAAAASAGAQEAAFRLAPADAVDAGGSSLAALMQGTGSRPASHVQQQQRPAEPAGGGGGLLAMLQGGRHDAGQPPPPPPPPPQLHVHPHTAAETTATPNYADRVRATHHESLLAARCFCLHPFAACFELSSSNWIGAYLHFS
jgi:hypothetical protein